MFLLQLFHKKHLLHPKTLMAVAAGELPILWNLMATCHFTVWAVVTKLTPSATSWSLVVTKVGIVQIVFTWQPPKEIWKLTYWVVVINYVKSHSNVVFASVPTPHVSQCKFISAQITDKKGIGYQKVAMQAMLAMTSPSKVNLSPWKLIIITNTRWEKMTLWYKIH